MPIYEYKCQQCGSHFEVRQSVSEGPLKVCQKCGGPLEKQWSRTGFQFKGEGWYVTDYGAKKEAKGVSDEKSSGSESTTKSDSASNTKSDSASKTGTTSND
jgi:putative FmdB family regulatory protein